MGFIVVVFVLIFLFLFNKKRRELRMGPLIYHKEIKSIHSLCIIEQVQFDNAIECIKNYNRLVMEFTNGL